MILIQNADFVIQNAITVLRGADVLIDGERIKAIGQGLPAEGCERVLDGRGKIVSPGFVNAHTHLYQNMLKGCREDLLLMPWCEEVTFPFSGVIKKHIKEENNYDLVYYYGLLGAVEQLRSGITTFVDMDIIYDALFESWVDVGVRGVAALQLVNRWVPKELMVSDEVRYRTALATIDKWHNKGLLKVAMAPSTPFICTPEFLTWIRDTAAERELNVFCHVSENPWEIEQSIKDVGMTPLAYLKSIGFLDKPFCAVHGVQFTPEEMQMAQDCGVSVCYNPKSNMKLGSGIAPVKEYLERGVPVVVGTDGAASNDLLDMFEDMRTGLMMQKLKYLNPAAMSANEIFRAATQTGAELLGIDAGVLEEGKLADVILLDYVNAHFGPVHDVMQNLVYCGKEQDVKTVIINGKLVLDDGVLTTIDEKAEIKKATDLALLRYGEGKKKIAAGS